MLFGCSTDDALSTHELDEQQQIHQLLIVNKEMKKKLKKMYGYINQLETQHIADKALYERELGEARNKANSFHFSTNSSHQVDLSQLREVKDQEISELRAKLARMQSEASEEGIQLSKCTTRIASLENDLSACRKAYTQELLQLTQQYEADKKEIVLRRSQEVDEHKSALLRRAMIAETENTKLMESLDTQAVQQKQTSEKELLFLRTKLENYENEINRLRRRESESCGIPSEDAKWKDAYDKLSIQKEEETQKLKDNINEYMVTIQNLESMNNIVTSQMNELFTHKEAIEVGVRNVINENNILQQKLLDLHSSNK